VNVPIKLQTLEQDVVINPGDYIIGDVNGVVCLPKELAEKVVDLIPSQVEADAMISRDIKEGALFVEASKKYRAGVKKV
jgi:regulator of RNase E activity RraA